MKQKHIAGINELKNLTGAGNTQELCEFLGCRDAKELWTPVKEDKAAATVSLSVTTLRNYRHLSKGPQYLKHGSAVLYLPLDLHLYNLRNRVMLEEVA